MAELEKLEPISRFAVVFQATSLIITITTCQKLAFIKCLVMGGCHKRQKPQAPIHNRQTRKIVNAKGLNRNTNLT